MLARYRGISCAVVTTARRFAGAGYMIRPDSSFDVNSDLEGDDSNDPREQAMRKSAISTQIRKYYKLQNNIRSHPDYHVRLEQLKPKQRRRIEEGKSRARIVNDKIKSLVELIYFKRSRKMH